MLRVMAGTARGVPLQAVPDLGTRPILDRLKKSLFSILENGGYIHEARVMDCYAGTGTMGIEALSRGAAHCTFVEKRGDAVKLLRENLAKTKLEARADVRQDTAERVLKSLGAREPHSYTLIVYDPPFEFSREAAHRAELEAELTLAAQLLIPEGWLALRTEKAAPPPTPAGLVLARPWTDGTHAVYFFGRG
jgi:16S rRNA (guanine(966)-N(2))-methyltransferase RsmD